MDLCLPENWSARPGGVFRDDLGPAARSAAPQAFVCGLRDWRAPKRPLPVPLRGNSAVLRAPRGNEWQALPYRAPAWLRGIHPA